MSPYNPDWDADLKFGERMELEVEGVLSAIRNGGLTYEVKADRYLNGRWFLEWEQNPRRCGEWKSSGLQTTMADLWVIRLPQPVDAIEIWRTSKLRQIAKSGLLGHLKDGGASGDNPTRGWVVWQADLVNKARILHQREITNREEMK